MSEQINLSDWYSVEFSKESINYFDDKNRIDLSVLSPTQRRVFARVISHFVMDDMGNPAAPQDPVGAENHTYDFYFHLASMRNTRILEAIYIAVQQGS